MNMYKQLRYKDKTLVDKRNINRIIKIEGLDWFLDCEVENTDIEIINKKLIFKDMTSHNGNRINRVGVFT